MNDRLDAGQDRLLDLAGELISFQTVAPPGSMYGEIVDYLIPLFKELGFSSRRVVIPQDLFMQKCNDDRLIGERVNLIAQLDAGCKETLAVYTHLDVVPPGDEWSSDPFSLTIKGDRAFGRGISDSKGAVASMINAFEAVIAQGRPKYNLQVLLTTDEEVADYSGLCFLADHGLIKADKMLCMDGFSDDVCIASNGTINWEVTVHGRAAHSGTSFLGVNAIEKAFPVVQSILAKKKEIESRRSTVPASSALKAAGYDLIRPMFNLTMINAGIKENIVPNRCVLRGDRRVIPEESMEGAMVELEGFFKSITADLDILMRPGFPPMRMNPEHPWVGEVCDAVQAVTGFRPALSGTQGSLDQAYAAEVTRIPACVYGVGRQLESNIHGADENVRLEDLFGFARFIARLVSG